jgi:hypothetical protein
VRLEGADERNIPKQSYQTFDISGETQNVLNAIYEEELIPLYKLITHLRQELDTLSSLRPIFKDKVKNPLAKPIRVGRNKKCICWRR